MSSACVEGVGVTGPDRQVQQRWADTPVRQRLCAIRRLRQRIAEEAERLCAAVADDLGKPPAETAACELLPWADACRFLEQHAPRLLRPRRVPRGHRPWWLAGQRDWVLRRPRGIVGIIGTWNYPLFLNGVQIAQALAAGNAVLWKPSEAAPRTAEVLWQVLTSCGFPDGLLARLPATREAGRLLTDADVDHVLFTGHAETGRLVASHLGRRLVSCTLELSGCDAMFVLADADLDLAARAAWFGATLNAGQTCLAVRRIFVDREVYVPFLQRLEPLAAAARPMSLALASQVRQAQELIADALAGGARLLAVPPCQTRGEAVMLPAILADASPSMRLCREAAFAPIAAVVPFDRLEQALADQDLCPYALGASVFTQNRRLAWQVAARLKAGSVCINDVIAPTAHPATSFGGSGASGWGVTQGAEGLLELTVPQVVSHRSGTWRPHYHPPETSPWTSSRMLLGLLRCLHGAGWRQRLAGLGQLWRAWLQA